MNTYLASCRRRPLSSNVRRHKRSQLATNALNYTAPANGSRPISKPHLEPTMINRAAMVVRPLGPFLDWARSMNGGVELQDFEKVPNVYLVPEIGSDQEEHEILLKLYPTIFGKELFEHETTRGKWPKDRSLLVFMNWFKIEIFPVVEDLCSYPIANEEM